MYTVSKKFVKRFFIISALVILLAVCFFTLHETRVKKIDVGAIREITADDGVVFNVDDVVYGRRLAIAGSFALKGRQTVSVEMHILLRDTDTDEYLQLPTEFVQRTDVTSYMDDGLNYDNSGFYAEAGRFMLKDKGYELAVLYKVDDDEYVFNSGQNVSFE